MIEWFLKNWLSVIVTIYIISMILYGHRKGFFRVAISTFAIILTLIISNLLLPRAIEFVRQNTELEQGIQSVMLSNMGIENIEYGNIDSVSGQQQAVNTLVLPKSVKKMILSNNNSEVWAKLGVDRFIDYISSYLSNIILNAIGFVVIFFIVWLILHILMEIFDIVSKIPIIHGLNQIFGAVMGLFNALMILWILSIFVMAVSGTSLGKAVLEQINGNIFLSWIFNANLISAILRNMIYFI